MRREAFEAALAGAHEAARLAARREAFELYRRAVDNMPDALLAAERAAILEEYGDAAGDIEEHETCIGWLTKPRRSTRRRHAGRSDHDPRNVFGVWRREGRPLSDRVAMARGMWAELEGCRGTDL